MPLAKDMYVRYWDGSAECFGKIVEVRQGTYCIRVGGMDTIVEVPHGRVAVHPTAVASGRLLGPLANLRVPVSPEKYLYHATSWDLVPTITTKQALIPRSRVDWGSLGGSVWTGTEKAVGRVQSASVRVKDYFGELSSTATLGNIPDATLLGDVGEFFYATLRNDDILINYVAELFQAGKAPVVVRFRNAGVTWYRDPKAAAVMTMNAIPLHKLEMKYIPKDLKGIAKEDDLVEHIQKVDDWVACSEQGWMEVLDLAQQFDF